MTSSVIVTAHCADTKEVSVMLRDNLTNALVEEFKLQDGEEATRYVYDDLIIKIKETEK